jgi:glycosyltransferase involved in cell wall biosynthesis
MKIDSFVNVSASPLVSIIVPTRDRAVLLARAIASIQMQSLAEFEVLVVDNSRVSAARDTASAIADRNDPRIRVLSAPTAANAGSVRNVGLDAALGEWVTFLDDDDAYRPDKLAKQLALACATASPLVLCGARFHVRGRARVRHCGAGQLNGDGLLNAVGLGTPFLFHRRNAEVRFDESLQAGEDFHYGQCLLARFNLHSVPVVPEPLVDVYQDGAPRARTNLHADAGWRAARRVWRQFGDRYSPAARRLFMVRARVTHAKLRGDTRAVLRRLPALFRAGGPAEWRFAANAVLVSAGWWRGRWVT